MKFCINIVQISPFHKQYITGFWILALDLVDVSLTVPTICDPIAINDLEKSGEILKI